MDYVYTYPAENHQTDYISSRLERSEFLLIFGADCFKKNRYHLI